MRRILHVTYSSYLDDSSGASIASRSMLEYLARNGFAAEVVCGPGLEAGRGEDVANWASSRGLDFEVCGADVGTVEPSGVCPDVPPHLRIEVSGVSVAVLWGSTTPRDPDEVEHRDFLSLFEAACTRFRPYIVITYGGGPIAREVLKRARAGGSATIFALHNLRYRGPPAFADADAVIVASRFASDYYATTLGLRCVVMPNIVDLDRVRVKDRNPKFVVFVNPTVEKGVFLFARIADEVGRTRPDIRFLVVESKAIEADVASCGLDLRASGNVFFLANSSDPRRFWRLARICLVPSLVAENQPMTAIEAMTNGIPVIGSDRGGIPEVLGTAGTSLPIPARLAPTIGHLATADEAASWVETIVRLWENRTIYEEQSRRSLSEASRWSPEILGPKYAQFFSELRSASVDRSSIRDLS